MTSAELSAIGAILMMGCVTFLTRIGGAVMMERVSLTPRVRRFLEGMSSSVLAALVASVVAQGGLRDVAAVAVAGALMLGTKNATLAMVVGMSVAAAWTAFAL